VSHSSSRCMSSTCWCRLTASMLSDGSGLFGRIRVGAGGAVTVVFFWRYRRDGEPRNLGVGTWPKTSLKDIRTARNEARKLHDCGTDPADARKKETLEKRAAQKASIAHHESQLARPILRKLFEQWESADLANRKDKGAETARGFTKDVLPAIGERFAADITRGDIMKILDGVKTRGANRLANRLLAELRQMFGFAVVRELVTTDPTTGIEKKHVGGADGERDRTLSEKELRALPAALESADLLDSAKHALLLILGTNARVGEVIKARTADIDLDAGTWRIPPSNAKNEEAHMVFLSPFALPPYEGADGPIEQHGMADACHAWQSRYSRCQEHYETGFRPATEIL
jgi:hypothetical protein